MATDQPAHPEGSGSGVTPAEVDRALATLRQALSAHQLPKTFSDTAWTELLERESEFVSELGLEAIRRARQKREEVVSRADVADADNAIRRAGQTSVVAAVQAVGGLLFGGGITGIAGWASDSHPSTAA